MTPIERALLLAVGTALSDTNRDVRVALFVFEAELKARNAIDDMSTFPVPEKKVEGAS